MVKELLKLTIESIAYGGMGIARHAGIVHFVPATCSGETVLAVVTQRKATYAIAQVREIITPSATRIVPACPFFSRCGGCAYLHMAYAEQLKIKEKQLHTILMRLGKVKDPPVAQVIASPNAFYYRNRITLHKRKACGHALGFFADDNETIIPIDHCLIAQQLLNAALANILKNTPPLAPTVKRFDDVLLTTDGARTEVCFTTQRSLKKASFSHMPDGCRREMEARFSFTYGTVRCEYGSSVFFQTNTEILRILCAELSELVRTEGGTLIDAYCGVGIFSLLLREKFRKVIGIEENPRAAEWALHNATINDAQNVFFITGRVEQKLAGILKSVEANDCTLLLDPPRSGVAPHGIAAILNALPRMIIYISCEPTTFARDLVALSPHYQLKSVIPFDMFPQTKHIESVAVLSRNTS